MTPLGAGARAAWAKSLNESGEHLALHQHLDDTAGVMRWLLDHWASPAALTGAARASVIDPQELRTIAIFLASIHDIGKVTPVFARMDQVLAAQLAEAGLVDTTSSDQRLHHTRSGYRAVINWLAAKGVDARTSKSWATVIAGHHGDPPTTAEIRDADPARVPAVYGGEPWDDVRRELLDWRWAESGLTVPQVRLLHEPTIAWITGLVIMADWIASNEEFFPYTAATSDRVGVGLRALGLPPPWRAEHTPRDPEVLITERFDLPPRATPRPSQVAAVEAVWEMPEPGLLVIEAPMGEGKTEAALAAAEVLAHRFGCGGIFLGLPTQATTDAMFGRTLKWIEHLPADDLEVGASLALIHGKARLNKQFSELRRTAAARGVDIDSADPGRDRAEVAARAMVHSWMQGRKKAVLASVVIATVDHLLFGALRSRHLALRMAGLMGKVVIVDEVHAYDTWMSTYLHRALQWLASVGTPVILLSATLPSGQRSELVEAYAGSSSSAHKLGAADYPRITTATTPVTKVIAPDSASEPVEVQIDLGGLGEDHEVADLIEDATGRRGCVLVVRNTVRRAQATARALRDVFGPDAVTVSHSQFLAVDRARKDEELLTRFGPPGAAARPPFLIVVATQVVEQSLDVDFDLLITDVAPMDLILQRCGRLHRHERARPSLLEHPRCVVVGFSLESLEFPGSEAVYGRQALLASLAVMQDHGRTVVFPHDIPVLVDRAYAEPPIPTEWEGAWVAATERASKDRELARFNSRLFCIAPPDQRSISGWGSATVGDPESDSRALAAVRDIDPTLEVIVVVADEGAWRTPEWIGEGGGLLVPQDRPPSTKVAQAMARCTLRLPRRLSRSAIEDALWEATPEAWEENPLVAWLPVLVLGGRGYRLPNYVKGWYDPDLGLREEVDV